MDNSLTAFTKKIKFNISSRFLNHNTLIHPCVGWLSSHIREQKLTCKCMSPMTQPQAWTHFSPRQLKVCLHQTIFSFGKRHYYTSVTTMRDRQEQKPKPTERQWAVPVSPVILARLLRSSEPQAWMTGTALLPVFMGLISPERWESQALRSSVCVPTLALVSPEL